MKKLFIWALLALTTSFAIPTIAKAQCSGKEYEKCLKKARKQWEKEQRTAGGRKHRRHRKKHDAPFSSGSGSNEVIAFVDSTGNKVTTVLTQKITPSGDTIRMEVTDGDTTELFYTKEEVVDGDTVTTNDDVIHEKTIVKKKPIVLTVATPFKVDTPVATIVAPRRKENEEDPKDSVFHLGFVVHTQKNYLRKNLKNDNAPRIVTVLFKKFPGIVSITLTHQNIVCKGKYKDKEVIDEILKNTTLLEGPPPG